MFIEDTGDVERRVIFIAGVVFVEVFFVMFVVRFMLVLEVVVFEVRVVVVVVVVLRIFMTDGLFGMVNGTALSL